jgi:type I restriction enzyme S subunit
LGEVCEIKGGKRLPKGETLVLEKTSHPYIRITDLENNQIKKHQLQFVTDEAFQNISRYIVNTGDVIVSIVGSIGFVAFIDEDLDNASLTENCVKFVNLKNLDSKFLYYFLISKNGQEEIAKNTVGAVQKKLPIYGVQNIQLLLPPLPEQKAIASVLSIFDDKIELLREQNKTLEEIGQTIFKEWFLPSRPSVGRKGQAGGKYGVDDLPAEASAQAGELPEGWRVGKLGEICSLKSGFAFSGNDFVEGSNTMVLKIKDLKGDGIVDLSDISFVKDGIKDLERVQYFKLKSGDIVLAMSGNTTGKIGIIPHLEGELFLNQRVGKIFIDEKIYKTFIYFFLMSGSYQEKILAMGYGSAQPNINPTQIENIDIIYPDNKILENFVNTTNPIFIKILDNLYQIQSLARNRDELLPKLMSGQVRAEF